MDPTDFVGALYGAIIGDSHAVGGVQAGSSSYVTLEWPGMPIDPSQYGTSGQATTRPARRRRWRTSPALSMTTYRHWHLSTNRPDLAGTGFALIPQATVAAGPLANTFAAAQATFAGVIRGRGRTPRSCSIPAHRRPGPGDPAGEAGWRPGASAGQSGGTTTTAAGHPNYCWSRWQVAALPSAPPSSQLATRGAAMAAASHVAVAPQSRPAPAMATATLAGKHEVQVAPAGG